MTTLIDALPELEDPDRVHYEIGVMLNAEDFQAEQDYHRGRLARALQYVIGSGTLAGLAVAQRPAAPDPDPAEEELRLEPGLALDGFGRLIEVQRPQCIRLARWFDEQDDATLRQAWRAADAAFTGAPEGVVADLAAHFMPCPRGKTPSFAKGPFDGLDAVTADRVRDGFELELSLQTAADLALPASPWQAVADAPVAEQSARLRQTILDAWRNANDTARDFAASSNVFLARVVIEAPDPTGAQAVVRAAGDPVQINNTMRPFAVSAAALAVLTGAL